jgi:hypothetical protein
MLSFLSATLQIPRTKRKGKGNRNEKKTRREQIARDCEKI